MSSRLKLQLIMGAVDNLTGPLKRATQGSKKTAAAMRATRNQLKGINSTARDLDGLRKMRVEMRGNERQLKEFTEKQRANTEALEKNQEQHRKNKTALQGARREHNKLAKALIDGKGDSAEFRREYDKATIRLRAQEQAFGKTQRAVKLYRDRAKNAGVEVERLSQKNQELSGKLNPLRERLQAAGVNTDQLGQSARKLRNDSERLNASLEEQKQRLDKLAASQRKYQDRVARMQRLHSAGLSVGAHGAGALFAGQAAGRGMASLVAPGVSFGEQLSELQAISRLRRDDARFIALQNQAQSLGATTAFTATEVSAGQTFLARAGFTPEAIRASMRDMLNLALANNTDLARTADIASNISSAFKIDPQVEGNMQRVADVLSGTAARANVDLAMLGDTMKYLGQAEGLDVSLEQAATLSGLLGNIGIQGSQAGTTLRAMLNRLSAPLGTARKAMDELGLRVEDDQGNMRNIIDLLDDVSTATQRMGNVERASYLKRIFGEEAGSGVAELIGRQGEGALVDLLTELRNVQGENNRMAETMTDNLGGDLKNLNSAWENIGITVSQVNDGPLRDLTQELTGVLRQVADWIKQNPELTARIAKFAGIAAILLVGLGALGIAVGSLMIALSGLGRAILFAGRALIWGKAAIAGIGKALLLLSRLLIANPIGLAVAALVTGALAIIKYWDRVKAFFSGFWQGLTEGLAPLRQSLSGLADAFAPLRPLWDALSGAVGRFVGWLGRLLQPVQATEQQLQGATNAGRTFGLVVGFAIDSVARIIGGAFRLIGAGVRGIVGLFSWLTEGAMTQWAALREGWTSFWSGAEQAWNGGFLSMAKWVGNGLANVGKLLLDFNPLGLLYTGFADLMNWLGVDMPRKFTEAGAALMDGLINGIKGKLGGVRDAVNDIADSTIGWFKDKLGIRSPSRVFARFGQDTLAGYQLGIDRNTRATLNQVGRLGQRITAAGAGVALTAGAATMPAAASVQWDNRPPIERSAPAVHIGGDTIEIHIHAAPGMNEQAIARQVQRAIEERERHKAAQARALLQDR